MRAPRVTVTRRVCNAAAKRSFFEVAADRVRDTVEDVELHYRRYLKEVGKEVDGEAPTPKAKLVVLGSGWGAHSLIKIIDTDKYDVTVISPRNHFIFTPMLPSCAVGTVEIRSVADPIRLANRCALVPHHSF